MREVSRIGSGERMNSATGMLILCILDKFVRVNVFRERHGGGERQRGILDYLAVFIGILSTGDVIVKVAARGRIWTT